MARLLVYMGGVLFLPKYDERRVNTLATKSKEEILAGMDGAATEAAEALKQIIVQHPQGVEAVANWWKVNFPTAGSSALAGGEAVS